MYCWRPLGERFVIFDVHPPGRRGIPGVAARPRPSWVPAADDLTPPFTSQAIRASPALPTLIAATRSAFDS
jgi:hypothetical protein